MPADCPHVDCDFFLWNTDAACPACGRRAVPSKRSLLQRIATLKNRGVGATRTLDERYQQAVDDCEGLLKTWMELWGQTAEPGVSAHRDAVVFSENLASETRAEIAAEYLENALDRVRYLTLAGLDSDRAFELVDRCLNSLWLDQRDIARAERQIADLRIRA